ncbi:MAG: hypothetical protein JXK51_00430 [Halothiobacillaceae bacterium]|nr:hypothetical protein [Halothiobacillaceae bacterium]HUM98960.1 hypothetical protein [Halothiobacillus sp.]
MKPLISITLFAVAFALAGCSSSLRSAASPSAASEGPHIYGQINSSYTKKLN